MTIPLNQTILDAFAQAVTPELIKERVAKHVDDLVKDALRDALSSYGETGKAIKAAVVDALKVNRLDLPSYGETVTKMLRAAIEAQVSEVIAGKLAEDMNDLLSLAPKTIKLSQIVKEMLDDNDIDFEVYCKVEHTDYSSTWVFLHPSPCDRKYEADAQILIREDGTIASATLGGKDMKAIKSFGRTWGIEQKVRAYYACGTIIELDEDYVVTERDH